MYNRLSQLITLTLILLTPLVFWTLTSNLFNFSKLLVILTLGLILGLAYFFTTIVSKSLVFPKSTLATTLVLFILAIAASLVMNQEGRPEALAGKGALLLVLPLISLFLMAGHHSHKLTRTITFALMGTGCILAIHSLLQLTFLSTLSSLPSFMQTKLFTPTGDYLTTLILIILGTSASINQLKTDTSSSKFIYLLLTLLGVVSSVAIISLMLPGSPLSLTLIPYKESWAITLDALKSTRSLFFGVGLANYSLLFTAVKPLSLNLTSLWSSLPQSGTSELLTLFATTGILGGLSFIYLSLESLRAARNTDLYFPLLILVLALILTPGTIVLYLLFFVCLSSLTKEGALGDLNLAKLSSLIGIVGILTLSLGYLYSLRPIISERYITLAKTALKNNDGKRVYDYHLQAIKYYPQMTTYHLSFAETNLSLASALSQKENLSDEDKSTISTLIQQAISESKKATALRPNYSNAWLTLAKVYRNLINVATGADAFAIDNYAQAIKLDPANPALRVEFGGLFYQLAINAKDPKDKDNYLGRAKTEFQTAIQLKPNYPNAYYNLAKIGEATADYENAYLAMQKTISLLGPDNVDLGKATAELENLKSKLPKPTPTPSPSPAVKSTEASDLATPSPLPSPFATDTIRLNE
jgi:cytochrome c-type biogenesis protein CcmH/NrfG